MRAFFINLAVVTSVGVAGQASAQLVRSASGANAAAIQSAVDAFRADLGTLNPNVAGTFGSGRREINWDAVPDAFSSPNPFPSGFFNANSPRGVVVSTPGTGFQNSANAASGTSVRFGNLNPAFTTQFGVFSPQRLFTPVGSVYTDVNFFVAGSSTPGATRGFGVVFTDVDIAGSARIELFKGADSLGTFDAPAFAGNAGLSFIGVSIGSASITRVRITSGSRALSAGVNESLPGTDLVVMDDFIFGETVPAPGTLALLGLSLAVAARRRRR